MDTIQYDRRKYDAASVKAGPVSLEGLRGRQSVRVTFQLPEMMIELLGVAAAQFGVKQKSLLDSLMEDGETLSEVIRGERRGGSSAQQKADSDETHKNPASGTTRSDSKHPATEAQTEYSSYSAYTRNTGRSAERRRKTFVISRQTLQALENAARKNKLPRDQLVELSIGRLVPVIAAEYARHEKRERILDEVEEWLSAGDRILAGSRRGLGADDTATVIMESMIGHCFRQLEELRMVVEKGRSIGALEMVAPKELPGGTCKTGRTGSIGRTGRAGRQA